MDYSTNISGQNCTIAFRGDFGFSDNEKVQQVIKEANDSGCSQCTIDLSGLQSIDSAGLGMFLLLKEMIGSGNLELKGPTGQVKKMLEISNFAEILSIKP